MMNGIAIADSFLILLLISQTFHPANSYIFGLSANNNGILRNISNNSHQNILRNVRDVYHSDFDYKKIRPCNYSKYFCDNVEDYPKTEIMEALRKSGNKYDEYFSIKNYSTDILYAYRFREIQLKSTCEGTQKKIYYPQKYKNDRGYFNFIVNIHDDLKYTQPMSAEVCGGENESCNFEGTLVNGYKSICIQKYTSKKMIMYDSYERKLKIGDYQVPICCECKLIYYEV